MALMRAMLLALSALATFCVSTAHAENIGPAEDLDSTEDSERARRQPREFVVKNLKKYGGFDEEAEGEEKGNKDENGKKIKFSNAGIAQANEGKVVIYYIEKRKKEKTGTLKMFHETLEAGIE